MTRTQTLTSDANTKMDAILDALLTRMQAARSPCHPDPGVVLAAMTATFAAPSDRDTR